jgi:hypothetical protein
VVPAPEPPESSRIGSPFTLPRRRSRAYSAASAPRNPPDWRSQ